MSEENASAGDDGNLEFDEVLREDEIDNLIGFDGSDEPDSGDATGGVEALINSNAISYERLPMLENVFERMVRLMTSSLRSLTSDTLEVNLDQVTSIRFSEYLNTVPQPALIGVARSAELDNFALISVDPPLIFSIVDVLLGGRRAGAQPATEGRAYTTIEVSLIQRLIETVLADTATAFSPLTPVTMTLERLETNPRFAVVTRGANAAIMAKFRIEMEGRGGCIRLVLPYATLEPIRRLLLQQFMGEKLGRDDIWENHLATEILSASLDLKTVVDTVPMRLGDVMELEEGQTVMLNATPESVVNVYCGDVLGAQGRMGRVGDKVAVRLEKDVRAGAAIRAAKNARSAA